ncbi:MerR family transcriptional regulator [Actinomadura atramentaria]|uniref:MerR family transcriptional regulator n=1 Tax=Actinomadura atramentaria TaxID=1990 RepID=UPI00037FFA6C|nr:MerR family transcriptional regulator [Actinomadura atramentaria]
MDDALFTIGDLARRTGLPVRTIRFYSDRGLVPPSARTHAGYRLYDAAAAARLDLVRTLRDLGLGLPAIRRVLDRESTIGEVAAAHADAVDVQIRTLRLRRAVLRAVARRDPGPEETHLMNKITELSDEERRQIITDFVEATFAGLDVPSELPDAMRAAAADLPDDPGPDQLEAWIELADLVRDEDFRRSVRRMAEYQAAEAARPDAASVDERALGEAVRERADAAVAAGIEPGSAAAGPVLDELVGLFADAYGRADDAGFRRWLLERAEIGNDPRAEHYWRLIGRINGYGPFPSSSGAFTWLIEALRSRV